MTCGHDDSTINVVVISIINGVLFKRLYAVGSREISRVIGRCNLQLNKSLSPNSEGRSGDGGSLPC